MDNALLSFFQQDKDLVTENRPLRLRLANPTQMLEDVLLPQRVQGNESICGSIEYRILCVSLDAFIPLKELIALPVAVDIVTDRGDLRSVCGIVTEASAGDSDGGLASYQLVLRDALSIMEKRNNTRVFRNKNEVEIVRVILDEWLQTNPIIGTCFRYEMDESFRIDAYPQREFTMQYNESDAAFIRRLLKRRGIAWYFRADQSDCPSHTMVLFDNADTLPPNAAGIVRYHRDAATEERDTITSWCAVRTLQPGSVSRFSWNYKNPQDSEFMTTKVDGRVDQGPNGNEMSATLDDYLVLSPHAGDDHDDLCQLGQLAMNRHDLESKCFHGEGSVRDFCVGEYFELEGHPEIDVHAIGEREFVISALQVDVSNNLSKDLAARVEHLFFRSRWMPGADIELSPMRVKVGFTAVRRGIPIVPAYDAQVDMPNVPLQSGVVVGPDGEEVHCDELGRVKVRFRTTRKEDHLHAQGSGAAENENDSAWVRVTSNWAGGQRGAFQFGQFGLPRIGTEVLIAFLGGDPDRPIVIGQLYNGNARIPAFHADSSVPANRYVSGIRSHEIRGSGANQIRLDDTPGELSVQLASSTEDSQLNLGFLTGPRVLGTGERRGTGAELRSAGITTVRGAGGLLLSGWRQSRFDAAHAECNEFKSLIEDSASTATQISNAAESRGLDPDLGDELAHLSESYRSWEGRGPNESGNGEISIASPSAIAMATAGTFASYSKENSYLISNKNLHFHAARSTSVASFQDISIFAYQGNLKAISGKGNFVIQSQEGTGEMLATRDLRITSTDGKAIVCASEIKLVSADGSYIRIGDGITLGSSGTVKILASKFIFDGPDTESTERDARSHERNISIKKREVEIEYVDADGNSPKQDELRLTFFAERQEVTQSITNGRGVLRDLPSGAFRIVQQSRLV
ncbi:type VI secretion system Vgr family protein [Duganella sp. Root198D2]|uniref:type VI secretion system Vgr family protein n=1 Tax=Duganella sp. Root198D2 TaxID=1736489 RepID=UPI00070DF391|nr:type VI secretion system Vgr family protein [Duganella sp. Root198D2]KRB97008.1 hypothetical protein ASE26_02930 [Duganella sp. Root198D2]